MRRILTAVLSVALCAGAAFGQVDTPTSTATPTSTPTPTLNRQGMLANQAACPTASTCDLPAVKAGKGYKSVAAVTTAGSASVKLMCQVAESYLAPEQTLATLTGATCSTATNCFKDFQTWCDRLWVRLAACNGCSVSAWWRTDP